MADNLEDILMGGIPAPYTQTKINPLTGLPEMMSRPPTKEELAIQQLLSAAPVSKTPSPKVMAPPENPTSPSYLPANAMQEDAQRKLRQMEMEGNVKIDRQKVVDLMNQQATGVARQEQELEGLRSMKQDINWKPLAAAISGSMSGGSKDFLESIPDAETPQVRAMRINQIQNLIQKQRDDQSERAIGLLKAEMGQANAKQERFEAAQNTKLFESASKDQAKFLKDASEYQQTIASVSDAIKPDASGTISGQRLQMAISNLSRLMGEKGVLTEQDVARQVPQNVELWSQKLLAKLASDPSYRVDAKQAEQIQKALEDAKSAWARGYKQKTDAWERGRFQNPGSPYAGKAWGPQLVADVKAPLATYSTPPSAATPGGGADLAALAAAEIKRRSGVQ